MTAKKYRMQRGRLVMPAVKKVRSFDLRVALPPYDAVVLEVLNSLETDRLMTLNEKREGVLDSLHDAGPLNLSGLTTQPASIRDWLSAGCQVIRWDVGGELVDDERKKGVMAMYRHNAAQVIFPAGVSLRPPGPAAYVGEIIVNAAYFPPEEVTAMPARLQFVLAHELTHVFDALRLLIPALKNWPMFWRNVLAEGDRSEDAALFWQYQAIFVDNYGSTSELEMVKAYWPSKAEEWFSALLRQS